MAQGGGIGNGGLLSPGVIPRRKRKDWETCELCGAKKPYGPTGCEDCPDDAAEFFGNLWNYFAYGSRG